MYSYVADVYKLLLHCENCLSENVLNYSTLGNIFPMHTSFVHVPDMNLMHAHCTIKRYHVQILLRAVHYKQ